MTCSCDVWKIMLISQFCPQRDEWGAACKASWNWAESDDVSGPAGKWRALAQVELQHRPAGGALPQEAAAQGRAASKPNRLHRPSHAEASRARPPHLFSLCFSFRLQAERGERELERSADERSRDSRRRRRDSTSPDYYSSSRSAANTSYILIGFDYKKLCWDIDKVAQMSL